MPELLPIDDYRARILDAIAALPNERMRTADAAGRILAGAVTARFAVPPFTNSAMDGYAVRAAEATAVPVRLPVAGDAPAGAAPRELPPGTAMRIMTGAPVPLGADAVVPVELTDQHPGAAPLPAEVEIRRAPEPGANIRRAGEDVEVGEVVLAAGTALDATAIAAAISVGHGEVEVARRPRVAVLSTGDELVAAGADALAPGRIPDSNGPMLAQLVRDAGGDPVCVRASTDAVDEFWRSLRTAGEVDLVVTTGGVSAGAFEVVRQALGPRGVEFVKVAMQPGKPQGFGTVELDGREVPVLCLPGNPMSVFVSFHTFVVPVLDRMRSFRRAPISLEARAAHEWTSPEGRAQIAPAVVTASSTGLQVGLPNPRGAKSHYIGTLHRANALVTVPLEVRQVRVGDRLAVRLLGPLREEH